MANEKYEWKEGEFVSSENFEEAISQMFAKRKLKINLYDIIIVGGLPAKQLPEGKEREFVDAYIANIKKDKTFEKHVLLIAEQMQVNVFLFEKGNEFDSNFPEDMDQKLSKIFYQKP